MPNSPSARTLARQLLARVGPPSAAVSDLSNPVAAIDEVYRQLAATLTRWFGPFGHHALLSRALAQARKEHPALENVRIRSAAEPSLEGLTECLQQHGAEAANEGVVAILMAFIDLLSRLIGEDMAFKLIDQSVLGHGPDTDVEDRGGAA